MKRQNFYIFALFLSLFALLVASSFYFYATYDFSVEHISLESIPPESPHIAVPGKLLLKLRSWRRPDATLFQASAPSCSGVDFSLASCRLIAVSPKAITWQLELLYWAIDFVECETVQVSYGDKFAATEIINLSVLPRTTLKTENFPLMPEENGKLVLLQSLVTFSITISFLYLLLAFFAQYNPKRRSLKQLKSLQYNKDNCFKLLEIWRKFSANSAREQLLGRKIKRLCFAEEGDSEQDFNLCKMQMVLMISG